MADRLLRRFRTNAEQLPGGEPVLDAARERADRAIEIVAAALRVDPTLADWDRDRELEVFAELLRQLRPLGRQAALAAEHARLTATGATASEFARLGRINPLAPEELDALSQRLPEIAQRISDSALPDWNTPTRIREHSERLLPTDFIAGLAEQLHDAVQPALELTHPSTTAVRIADLAAQLRAAATGERLRCCAAPGCERQLRPAATGRPGIYCGPTCRQRARRAAR